MISIKIVINIPSIKLDKTSKPNNLLIEEIIPGNTLAKNKQNVGIIQNKE